MPVHRLLFPSTFFLATLLLLATIPMAARVKKPPAGPAQAEAPDPLRQEYAALLQKKALLERELQLKTLQLQIAQDDAPYLLVDLEDQVLAIYIHTTRLKTFPILTAEIEGRRGFLSTDSPPSDWTDQTFELVAKSGPIEEHPALTPKTDEEREKARTVSPRSVTPDQIGLDQEPQYPSRYTLIYKEGLALNVRGSLALTEREKDWLSRNLDRLTSILLPPEQPEVPDLEPSRVWLYLGLEASQAQELYPSVYTGMKTMVRLPGDPSLD
ncbi:MAG: hypothetical protein ACE5HD_02850 [Acidobacteriota bacterium]